jgi:hypothetical protein
MKKIIAVAIVLILAAAISWMFLCNGIGRYKSMALANQNSKNISQLKAGMTKKEVLKIMGPPNKIEVYSLGGRIFEFMLYRTEGFASLFKDKEANYTAVALDSLSGVVLSLDRKFYNDILNSRHK